MNDKQATKDAERIRIEFWDKFEAALTPEKASKQCYLAALEELQADAQMRIDCVQAELADEG